MKQPTYDERIQSIAVEFAKEMHPQAFADRALSVSDSNYWHIKVDNYKPLARITAAEMAEAFRACHELIVCNRDCDSLLVERGLIPDQEVGKDEKD